MVKRRKRIGGAEGRHSIRARREWIYGVHAVNAALRNPARVVHRLLATAQAAQGLETQPIHVEVAAKVDIDGVLPRGAVHQGLALEADPLPPVALDEVLDGIAGGDRAVLVVLDQVTDPRNVGAILRSAAAFGAAAVVVQDRHAPPTTGALAKAASGALETVPLVRVVNLARALTDIQKAGLWCVGLDADAETDIGEADLTGRVALVLGAEGAGMRRLTRERCDLAVRLPMTGEVPSLNVSAAAAVALYAVTRRG